MSRKYIQDVGRLFDSQDALPVRKFAAASSISIVVAVRAAPLCRRHACLYGKSPLRAIRHSAEQRRLLRFPDLTRSALDRRHGVSGVHDAVRPISELLIVHAAVICCDKHEIKALDSRAIPLDGFLSGQAANAHG